MNKIRRNLIKVISIFSMSGYDLIETKEYKKWVKTYKPLTDRIYYSQIPVGTDIKNIWSVSLCMGCTFINNGIWSVNNEGFIVTEIPWEGKPGDIMFMSAECDNKNHFHIYCTLFSKIDFKIW